MKIPPVAFLLGLLAGGGSLAAPASAQPGPALILDAGMQGLPGVPVAVPLGFANNGHAITAIAFSLDLDPAGLTFDAADDDLDGVPDAVTLPAGTPSVVVVDYDPGDPDGELDVLLANLSGTPLAEGVIMEFELTPNLSGTAASWIRFSGDPPPSFGNDLGQDVAGTTTVLGGSLLFADGFESGDASAWSSQGRPSRVTGRSPRSTGMLPHLSRQLCEDPGTLPHLSRCLSENAKTHQQRSRLYI